MNSAKTINLPSPLIAGDYEDYLEQFFIRNQSSYAEDLIVNFKNCKFIDLPSLFITLSFITARNKANLRTFISLPSSLKVRNFLRLWDFPDAFVNAIGLPFSSFVVEEDRKYFSEKGSVLLEKEKAVAHDPLNALLSNRFFSIQTLFNELDHEMSYDIYKESVRWKQNLILSILDRHLMGRGGHISSKIVVECMLNAARHPHASILQTASLLTLPFDHTSKDNGFFTLVFWDDGISMLDTMKRAISSPNNIRNESLSIDEFQLSFKVHDTLTQSTESGIISSKFTPDRASSDVLILLSSLLPGITSDPTGKTLGKFKGVISKDLSNPGIGLYLLINISTDLFNGSISFRTKNYFMNIKKSTRDTNYKVKVIRYCKSYPNFLGNMVTVRLPLHL